MDNQQQYSLLKQYEERLPVLSSVCQALVALLTTTLEGKSRIDKIAGRPKTPNSFLEKALRLDEPTGAPKYPNPLTDIQDQIGLRVVVHYKSDVSPVREAVLMEFREIEDAPREQPRPDIFGYEAHHFVCIIPPDLIALYKPPIPFFELQVSTLFQHAWAQANHDLGYKPQISLDYDRRKRIAWAAAQAWGADEIFHNLWAEAQASNHSP